MHTALRSESSRLLANACPLIKGSEREIGVLVKSELSGYRNWTLGSVAVLKIEIWLWTWKWTAKLFNETIKMCQYTKSSFIFKLDFLKLILFENKTYIVVKLGDLKVQNHT